MRNNYMTEKCFRDIDKRIKKEALLDPEKRRLYRELQEKDKYLEDISRQVRKEMNIH